jgi:iron complex transport system substrate-binding protein
MVGKATGTEGRADALVTQMQRRIKAVTDKTGKLTAEQRPKVMYIVWHDPLMASGGDTFQGELISKAGGVNAFGDQEGYPSVSLEAVVQVNPAVIIAGIGMGEGMDAPLQFALTDPRLRDVDARRNNRVYGADSDTAGRAGPRIVDVLEEFAKLIHPEVFK